MSVPAGQLAGQDAGAPVEQPFVLPPDEAQPEKPPPPALVEQPPPPELPAAPPPPELPAVVPPPPELLPLAPVVAPRPQQARSVYLPGLPLPPAARWDLASINVSVIPGGTPPVTFTVRDFAVLVPLAIFFDYVSSVNAGTRIVTLTANYSLGLPMWVVTANGQQTNSQTFTYQFLNQVSAAYGVGTRLIAPLPETPLPQGSSLVFGSDGTVVGDVFSAITLLAINVPSGPLDAPAPAAPAPTPLLV